MSKAVVWRLAAACALAAGMGAAPALSAPGYPSKTLEFVVHVNPGGGTDVFARLVQEIITREKLVTQPMIVANKTGGAGAVAFTYVKSKRGDPHTILTIATGSCAVTSATGTGRQTLWRIERETGAKFKFVTFKAGSEAVLSVLGGHVPFTTENVSEAWAHIEAKKMRVLAVTTEQRMPAGVPKEAVSAMEGVLKKAHASPLWRDYSKKNMYEDRWMGSAEFAKYLAEQRAAQKEFIDSIGLSKK